MSCGCVAARLEAGLGAGAGVVVGIGLLGVGTGAGGVDDWGVELPKDELAGIAGGIALEGAEKVVVGLAPGAG